VGKHRYGVVGAGRQGTAAAYDLVVRGDAASVVLADVDGEQARVAAERVNRLAGGRAAVGEHLDVTDRDALMAFLDRVAAIVSAVPFGLNLDLARAAVGAGTHMCDLGGNTAIVLQELQLDDEARARGVCVVPDCGEAPGLANNLVAHAMSLIDGPEGVALYDGGLPLYPQPPWGYELTFHIDGLINEYDGATTYVVDGAPVEVHCLDPEEDELVDFGPPLGILEAFVANTGSTTPWTLGKGLRSMKAKVLRYPGHAAQFRAFRDAGLFSREPLDVGGVPVAPRELLEALLEPRIRATAGTRDVVINRVIVRGRHQGGAATVTVDLIARHDEALGFTAMEQATGWHAAMVCHLMASGEIMPGARPVEIAVDPSRIIAGARERGFEISERVEVSGGDPGPGRPGSLGRRSPPAHP
jgi:lysine 6-dehydrogenase